jgi:mRNA interferase RelE/StbE
MLLALAINPRAGDVKKRKREHTGKYRRRVGSYRIVYEIQDKILLVSVIWIGQRGGAYK